MTQVKIGISGWTFPAWRGSFYPKGLKQKDELHYASRVLSAIEINGTFYGLQKPHTFEKWYEETPENFVFAVKGPMYLSHRRRYKDFETPLANFLASGLFKLKEKLGAILWQVPPNLPFKRDRMEPFLAALPHSFSDAKAIAINHSDWLSENAFVETGFSGPIRHAMEVRHPSYHCAEFIELLRKYNVAVVVGDTEGRWPYIDDVTSDYIYVRLHGDETKYPEGYTKQAIETWQKRLQSWSVTGKSERLVFAFFDNDHKESAPRDALRINAYFHPIMSAEENLPSKIRRPSTNAPKKAKKQRKTA